MSTRASMKDDTGDRTGGGSPPDGPRPSRLRVLLTREQGEEDGVFRPVRLPLWTDLGISAGIVVVVAGTFVGFISWLAETQGR